MVENSEKYEIVFYDNSDGNHELLPKTKIALFGKKQEIEDGTINKRLWEMYSSPYLILSGAIIKDILNKKPIKELINSFYNYLKPTRYDSLLLNKTKIIQTFSSIESFFYDILFPNDKGKTRPLTFTPLHNPGFTEKTVSNTQFIKNNPLPEDVELAEKKKTTLNIGIQIFHFEKVYTIYDKLNNIIISESKAIKAVKEDPEIKKYIIKVDLRKYCISSVDPSILKSGKIYSLRGHYLIGNTFYNNKDKEKATYLIIENPYIINARELYLTKRYLDVMAKNFFSSDPSISEDDFYSLTYPQLKGKHIMNFLNLGENLKIPFLNKKYVLLDKECIEDETGCGKMISARKFVSNMFEAKYFIDLMKKGNNGFNF